MYNEEFSSLFYSVKHNTDHLLEDYNREILLMVYSDGIDLSIRLEKIIKNYNSLEDVKELASLSQLICQRIHLVEQLHIVKESLSKLGMRDIPNDNYQLIYN
jgi:hypothetical protein